MQYLLKIKYNPKTLDRAKRTEVAAYLPPAIVFDNSESCYQSGELATMMVVTKFAEDLQTTFAYAIDNQANDYRQRVSWQDFILENTIEIVAFIEDEKDETNIIRFSHAENLTTVAEIPETFQILDKAFDGCPNLDKSFLDHRELLEDDNRKLVMELKDDGLIHIRGCLSRDKAIESNLAYMFVDVVFMLSRVAVIEDVFIPNPYMGRGQGVNGTYRTLIYNIVANYIGGIELNISSITGIIIDGSRHNRPVENTSHLEGILSRVLNMQDYGNKLKTLLGEQNAYRQKHYSNFTGNWYPTKDQHQTRTT